MGICPYTANEFNIISPFFFFFFLQLEGMEDNRVLAGVYFVGSDIKIYVLNACAWEV